MANSALEIINDHIGGGQAKLVAYRKAYSGSGVYVTKFSKQDERLLESLMAARDLLDAAQFGINDDGFRLALQNWAALEWGGFYNRATLKKTAVLQKPEKRELVRG
jgi:hypothetical protein